MNVEQAVWLVALVASALIAIGMLASLVKMQAKWIKEDAKTIDRLLDQNKRLLDLNKEALCGNAKILKEYRRLIRFTFADCDIKLNLSKSEFAAILVGLHLLEDHLCDNDLRGGLADVATDGGTIEPLTLNDHNVIADLVERLSTG